MAVTGGTGWRLLLAALIAPLVPSAVLSLISIAGNLWEGLWAIMLVQPVSYAAMIFPGMPLYLLLRALRWDSAVGCIAIGVVYSSAATTVFMWYSIENALSNQDAATWGPALSFATIAGVMGAISGFVFWWVVRPRQALLHSDGETPGSNSKETD